ncbi:hypothetical protein J6590_033828 [Homalodisca vitripennis]|nr:hypothetical protein J6590_033828 [Homalodisca vitripennis]
MRSRDQGVTPRTTTGLDESATSAARRSDAALLNQSPLPTPPSHSWFPPPPPRNSVAPVSRSPSNRTQRS